MVGRETSRYEGYEMEGGRHGVHLAIDNSVLQHADVS